mgnify:CR=1 FL=1
MKRYSKIRDNLEFIIDSVKTALPIASLFITALALYGFAPRQNQSAEQEFKNPLAPVVDTSGYNFYAPVTGDEHTEDPKGIPMELGDEIDFIFKDDMSLPFRTTLEDIMQKKEQIHDKNPQKNESKVKQPVIREQLPTYTEKDYPQISKNIKHLMTNEFFKDENYLNEKDITQILDSYNSVLRGKGIEAKIINAAKKYGINPAILLGRLQVEQGLLTKQTASKNALKYAAGHGARDDKTLPSGGLYDQINKMAQTYHEHYENSNGNETLKIDNGSKLVKVQNQATYSLLKYTPHTHGARLNSEVVTNYVLAKLDK